MLADSKTRKSASLVNRAVCQENSFALGLCEASIQTVCGQNKEALEIDTRILPTIFNHMSHSASIKQMLHFLQLFKNGGFRQYDHQRKNMKVYNSSTPPSYNLDNIKAPTYLYSGSCDLMVAEKDIEHLREVLPNVKLYKNFKNFNHCDFNYGKNTRSLLFENILKAMNGEMR